MYVHVLVLPVWSGIFVQNESQSGDVACSSLLLEGVCLYVGPTVCTAAAGLVLVVLFDLQQREFWH